MAASAKSVKTETSWRRAAKTRHQYVRRNPAAAAGGNGGFFCRSVITPSRGWRLRHQNIKSNIAIAKMTGGGGGVGENKRNDKA